MIEKIYVLEALLDGINEKHSYVLATFQDPEAAKSFAELHCTERGGKYSIVVLESEVGKYYDGLELPKEIYRAKGLRDTPEYHKDWAKRKLEEKMKRWHDASPPPTTN